VEIVVSTYHLGLGGTESYTLTVAEQLQRLGHDVTVFYVELGPGVDIGRQFGLELRNREDDLPVTCDVVFAQESITSYQLADRYPTTPQAFAVHADEYDLSVPPQCPGSCRLSSFSTIGSNVRCARSHSLPRSCGFASRWTRSASIRAPH
jgi:hypothetical protein